MLRLSVLRPALAARLRMEPVFARMARRGCGSEMAALHKSPIVQLLWKERANQARVTASGAKPQDHILTKTPKSSRVEVQYNFKDDLLLKEQYQNFNGLMQFSKLFEDLDALAGNVAFNHCDDDDPETRMPHLVTASVDRIRLHQGTAIALDQNYAMSGQVSWVGSSSLVIHMKLTREEDAVDVLKVLEQFKVGQARCVVVAMESRNRTEQVAASMRTTYPNMPMVVRAHDEQHVKWLEETLNVKALVPEMIAVRFGTAVFSRLGYPQDEVKAVIQEQITLEIAEIGRETDQANSVKGAAEESAKGDEKKS